MICFDCPNTGLCRFFDFAMKAKPFVDMPVKSCQVKIPEKNSNNVVQYPVSKQRSTEEILKVSEKIRELQETCCEEPLLDENLQIDPQMCDICNEYILDKAYRCSKCGKTVCPDCMVESVNDKQIYCTECF